MHFKVTARTILQLGAELISSDAIAFYELIKNAFDAKSPTVTVRVVVRIPHKILNQQLERLNSEVKRESITASNIEEIKSIIHSHIEGDDSYEINNLKNDLSSAKVAGQLHKVLKEANYILFEDKGDGMSLVDLDDIYLTIGTRNRIKEKKNHEQGHRPILGEKGIGRLSVMRLGDGVRVETTKAGDKSYNILEIDWSIFSHDSDALLESVQISPKKGPAKEKPSEKGTKIYVFDLRSAWTIEKLRTEAKEYLGRLTDPFEDKNRSFIILWFNKTPVRLESIDHELFAWAHAVSTLELQIKNNEPILVGSIEYKSYNRKKTFKISGTHLATISSSDDKYIEHLRKLGSFTAKLYWFNRKLLTVKLGVINADYIKKLVETWGGGLMLFRDGFRVNPYADFNDDWLDLDRIALGSPGYKLNRRQIVGKVVITSEANPHLLDQTNREGLRENIEKKTLVAVLQYWIWKEIKIFLDDVKEQEDANIAALSLDEIEKRIEIGQKDVRAAVEELKRKHPAIRNEREILGTIEDVLTESADLFKTARASSNELEDRLKRTIDLAGLGLMVDVIAHELNRSTEHALKTIDSFLPDISSTVAVSMSNLKTQLKTLQARLKVIDPLGPSGRQVKEVVNLRRLLADVIDSHKAQFKRHNVECSLTETTPNIQWELKVVPGMIVQILENLIANSVFWIKQEQNIHKLKKGKIDIVLDKRECKILITDNGPGIPKSKREDVFRPFFSTKPPGKGRGLGLYISREMANYHKASLSLLDNAQKDQLNTFVLSLNQN